MTPQPNMSELRKGKLGNISRANYKARRRAKLNPMPSMDDLRGGLNFGGQACYKAAKPKKEWPCPYCGLPMTYGTSVKNGRKFTRYDGRITRGGHVHPACDREIRLKQPAAVPPSSTHINWKVWHYDGQKAME